MRGGTRGTEMEDILIVSCKQSQAAQLWVSYLNNCFEQISKMRNRPPFRILCVGVEDVVGSTPLSLALEEKMVRVKLQIVIVCSQLLDHIYRHPGPGTNLGRLLQPERVIAMLLGVEEGAVTEQHRAALISYQQWKRLTVRDQDEVFVRNFLDLAMNTLARSWRQQRKHGEKAQFSLHPKKVREGHNKILVLLNEPIEKDDKINITIDKNGEKLEITTITKRNPYTLHFLVPESCLEVSTMVTVQVEKNGTPLGGHLLKCESKMRQLDQILRSSDNPLEFMCQTLGFSPGDRDHLDNFLVTAFQRNVPQNFSLLQTVGITHHSRSHSSPEEYPTLLHFAARFGLEKLAWQLLECPGGEQACEIRNVCELTPAEMAEVSGHGKLAQSLRGYMQMNEFTSMYSYLKIMSEGNSKSSGFNEAEYHRPRPLSETYQVPPSARNLIEQNYQVPPSARPYTPQMNSTVVSNPISDSEMAGYMEMHSSNFVSLSPTKRSHEFTSSSTKLENRTPSPDMNSSHQLDQEPPESGSEAILTKAGCFKKSQDHLNQGIQDELVEIINDFKNNVFTISEVEKLVEAWKNRNDVKQSFKEKQQQLSEMREQYERIQQCMKEEMKRPTPFERVRKFFKGKSKEVKDNAGDTTTQATDTLKTVTSDSLPICHRPASSLSLHSISSSSSSGRMSTVSGCSGTSLGDSGTHSDAEDRKNTFESIKMNGKAHIQNYEVPPTPRPFQSRISPPRLTTCIENRPPQPVPRSDKDNTVTKEEDIYDTYVTPDAIPAPEINGSTENYKTPLMGHIRHKNGPSTTADAEYLHLQIQENFCQHTLESPETPLTPTVDYMNLHLGIEPSNLPEYMNIHLSVKDGSAPPIPPRGDLVLPCPQK